MTSHICCLNPQPEANLQRVDLSHLAWPLWDKELAKAVDELSIRKHEVSALTLMQPAGTQVARFIIERYGHQAPLLILCGPGNNGGDGIYAARLFWIEGLRPAVFLVREATQSFSEPMAQALASFKAVGGLTIDYAPGGFGEFSNRDAIVVDAILGLRGRRPKQGAFFQALDEARGLRPKTVVAIDLPSGLEADRWGETDTLLAADVTITFGALKPVHCISPARSLCGEIVVLAPFFPEKAVTQALNQEPPQSWRLNPEAILRHSPWLDLSREAHKFDRGHVLVIGGSTGKLGAPILAAKAAMRCGAGWLSAALATGVSGAESHLSLDICFEGFFASGVIQHEALRDFVISRRVKSVIIGPGTISSPLNTAVMRVIEELCWNYEVGFVLDAGALHAFGTSMTGVRLDPKRVLLTPHPGEYRAIEGLPPRFDRRNELESLIHTLSEWGVSLLYKSATPLMISPLIGPSLIVADTGSPSLAKAGSGDVLTGAIAAHLARKCLAPIAALRSQVILHQAAEKLSQVCGPDGLMASELCLALKV